MDPPQNIGEEPGRDTQSGQDTERHQEPEE